MGTIAKYYKCRVCDKDCYGLFTDGDLFDFEVCSKECLVKLNNIIFDPAEDICANCDYENPSCNRCLGS